MSSRAAGTGRRSRRRRSSARSRPPSCCGTSRGAEMSIDLKSMGYVRVSSTDPEQWRTFAGKVLGLAEGRGPSPEHLYYRIDQVSARLVVVPADVDRLECVGWEVADHRALQDAREHLVKAGVE